VAVFSRLELLQGGVSGKDGDVKKGIPLQKTEGEDSLSPHNKNNTDVTDYKQKMCYTGVVIVVLQWKSDS
jgi:hypothetical protein